MRAVVAVSDAKWRSRLMAVLPSHGFEPEIVASLEGAERAVRADPEIRLAVIEWPSQPNRGASHCAVVRGIPHAWDCYLLALIQKPELASVALGEGIDDCVLVDERDSDLELRLCLARERAVQRQRRRIEEVVTTSDIRHHTAMAVSLRASRNRQAVLAELGRFALGCDDLQKLFDHACREVSLALGGVAVSLVGVQSNGPVFPACYGWEEWMLRKAEERHNESSRTMSRWVRDEQRVVVVRDTLTETRFTTSLLQECGMRSGVSAPVLVDSVSEFVLGAHSPVVGHFDDESAGFVESVAHILGEAALADRIRRGMEAMAGSATASTGPEFFSGLVKTLAEVLGVTTAFVGEGISEGARCRTLGLWHRGKLCEPLEYDLRGTPCEGVRVSGMVHVADKLADAYPDDALLLELGVVSYIGLALGGRPPEAVIGHIAIMHDRPIPGGEFATRILRLFAARVEAEIERERVDRDLKHRHRIETMISGISELLSSAEANSKADSLRLLGRAIGACRVSSFRFSPDGESVSNTAEWCSRDVPRMIDTRQDMLVSTMPWWIGELRAGRTIVLRSLSDVPLNRRALREKLTRLGITACIDVPVCASDGRLLGYLGVESCSGPRDWHEADVRAVSVVARMIGSHLERREALNELRLRDRAVAAAGEGILITDPTLPDNPIVHANAAFERLTGYAPELVVGRNCRFLQGPNTDPEAVEKMRAAIAAGEPITVELLNYRADGAAFWNRVAISPVRGDDGKVRNFIGVLSDVSHRVYLEAQLRNSQKMEALGTLAGGIAHDFNNILGPVFAHTQLAIAETGALPRTQNRLLKVLKSAQRAKGLVDRILAFSRKAPERHATSVLASVVSESAELLSETVPRNITLKLSLSDNSVVLADPAQVQQVVLNLVTNAIQAIGSGQGRIGITVSAKTVAGSDVERYGVAPGEYVVLEIADDGPGIPPDILPRVFEPFFTTKSDKSGTGLGLAAVHSTLAAAEGVVTVDSTLGLGATFRCWWPQYTGPAHAQPVSDRLTLTSEFSGRVLIVDDESDLAEAIAEVVSGLGFSVTVCHGPDPGRKAMHALGTDGGGYVCVLTDVVMPGMDGVELARHVRRIAPSLPVIAMTGFAEEEMRLACHDAGVASLLHKPVTVGALRAAIEAALGAAKA